MVEIESNTSPVFWMQTLEKALGRSAQTWLREVAERMTTLENLAKLGLFAAIGTLLKIFDAVGFIGIYRRYDQSPGKKTC